MKIAKKFFIVSLSFLLIFPFAEAKGVKGKFIGEAVKSVASKTTKVNKAEVLNNNRINGKKFEDTMFKNAQKKKGNVQRRVTLKTKSGTKVVVDMIKKHNNKLLITELKSSKTAPLTKNQKKGFPEIEKYGATVVGKGKSGFEGGTKIPPIKIFIKRNER